MTEITKDLLVNEAPSSDEKLWAIMCHLGCYASFIPMCNILIPLVIWLVKRDESRFIADQGREVLNFQISMMVYLVVSGLLCFAMVGFVFLIPLLVINFIWPIFAIFKVKDGEAYRYPLTVRFIS